MNDPHLTSLLEDLKHPDAPVRDRATQELWRLWFQQKGVYGLELIVQSQTLLDQGDPSGAEAILSDLINDMPDFAEAWNRRAVLHYTQRRYQEALQDCQVVLRLMPSHFGALHGLGLCYVALGEYRQAIRAFQQALEIQPYALINRRLLLECTAMLS